MRLINVKAFLEREQLMSQRKGVNRRTKVLEFCHEDEATKYAILSHRWIDSTEVSYDEMVDLAKMNVEGRDEIRHRLGYKKVLDTCRQASNNGYEWVWVDTCCIDKRSSAELSEAINSMYRWYANSGVCYAHLHDVHGSSFPTEQDKKEYPKSDGWPEWFSRGWTLQEMIASSNVQFFNSDWKSIGDKKALARTLTCITQVPEHILKEGLLGNRPCVAQIMSWAAKRTTTRVEDKAYSLMGLLDVNMPMLYGEGKKAFHRLQLEIIHTSNDQSIFAWGHDTDNVRTGSVLADDPSFFWGCSQMEPLDDAELIDFLKLTSFPGVEQVELPSIDQDFFGTFPVTNRGIHTWMLLRPYRDSDSVFQAYLPCLNSLGRPVTIDLVLWNSNYYRYSTLIGSTSENFPQLRQVYLRYQDMACNITFEIDDSAITENGFTCSDNYPPRPTGNTLALTAADPLCIRTYSERQGNSRFAVAFGQCIGQDWIHLINDPPYDLSWSSMGVLMVKAPNYSKSMADVPSRNNYRSRVWVHHTRIPGSTWIVRARRVVWDRSRIGVQIKVFQNSWFRDGLDEWKTLDIEASDFLVVQMDIYYDRT